MLWLDRVEDRDEFDAWLQSEPEAKAVKVLDPEQVTLRRALGLSA